MQSPDVRLVTEAAQAVKIKAETDPLKATDAAHDQRLDDLEVLGGLTPGDVNDATTASLIRNTGSETNSELSAAIDKPISDTTTGKAQRLAETGGARTAVLTGHSLMYGQDTTATGTLPGTNGASQTRAATPTTAQFNAAAQFISPGAVTTVNQAYPGDRTSEALTRWAGGSSGDLEIIWIDANDGLGSNGGQLSDAVSAENLRELIQRARDRGAEAVVVGGSPGENDTNSRKMYAAAQTHRTVAERMGARYIDAGELLAALPRTVPEFSSGVHLKAEAYSMIGTRLAALLGVKGVDAPKAAPGRIVTPRDRVVRTDGTIATRTGSADGSVWSLAPTNVLALAVEVTAPCVPLIRIRMAGTTGKGKLGVFPNLGASGRASRYYDTTSTNGPTDASGGYAYIVGSPLLSNGPDSVVLRCETGTIEIDSIRFIPTDADLPIMQGDLFDGRRSRILRLAPVGGASTARWSGAWDACYDVAASLPITVGSAVVPVGTRWLFDVALGNHNSGVALAHTMLTPSGNTGHGAAQGWLFIRSGATLIARKLENGGVSDTNFLNAFPSVQGIIRCSLEIEYDPANDRFAVYLDGVSLGTTSSPEWRTYTPGLICGAAATGGYAAGTGSVIQKVVNPV